jgi:hypothetical protein
MRPVPPEWRCDVLGCQRPIAVCVGDECRCYPHAVEIANEFRRVRGLPPLVLPDPDKEPNDG